MQRKTLRYLSGFFCLSLAAACSGGEGANTRQGNDPAKDWVFGKWRGTYSDADASEGSALRETTAKAVFEKTGDKQGEFKIKLTNLDEVYAKGRFHATHRQLLFDLKKSSLSAFGLSGQTATYDYSLAGNTLVLSDERIHLLLARQDDGNDEDGDGSGGSGKKDHFLVGGWQCAGPGGAKWDLTIKSTTKFFTAVHQPGRRSIWMEGPVKLTPSRSNLDAVLTVEHSRLESKEGTVYHLASPDETNLHVERMKSVDDELQVDARFNCFKKG